MSTIKPIDSSHIIRINQVAFVESEKVNYWMYMYLYSRMFIGCETRSHPCVLSVNWRHRFQKKNSNPGPLHSLLYPSHHWTLEDRNIDWICRVPQTSEEEIEKIISHAKSIKFATLNGFKMLNQISKTPCYLFQDISYALIWSPHVIYPMLTCSVHVASLVWGSNFYGFMMVADNFTTLYRSSASTGILFIWITLQMIPYQMNKDSISHRTLYTWKAFTKALECKARLGYQILLSYQIGRAFSFPVLQENVPTISEETVHIMSTNSEVDTARILK